MTGRPGWTGPPRHPAYQDLALAETSARCEHLKSLYTKPYAVERKGGQTGHNHQCWPPHLLRAWLSRFDPNHLQGVQRRFRRHLIWQASGRSGLRLADGWQDWSYQEPKEPSQRPERGVAATKLVHHEVKVEPTSYSQSAGSQDEWVGWAATQEHRSPPWEARAVSYGKGERARSASPDAPMVVAKRRKRGAAKSARSEGQQAWSHPPVRTQAIAPEPKKRPHSDAPKTAQARGCNNLQGVLVTKVDGQLQASGPPEKVCLVDPIAMQLLYLGDRRGAQDHLRNNRRAIRNRFEEYFQPGEQETPEQLLRFAEAN
eukprot:2543268-Amphidinium_carterae.1